MKPRAFEILPLYPIESALELHILKFTWPLNFCFCEKAEPVLIYALGKLIIS
jgi:hypothetical protein